VLDVVQVLFARYERAVADVALQVRTTHGQPPDQFVHHPRGHVLALVREDEAEHDQVAEQHPPVVAEAHQQPRPVDRWAGLAKQMNDIGAVEALTLLDECLRPDHLLDRRQSDDRAEHVGFRRVVEPQIVDAGDAVARAEDHVDEVIAAVDLAEPVRKRQRGLVAERLECGQHTRAVVRPHEDVDVLRIARHAREI
jgi:hypothetical protein